MTRSQTIAPTDSESEVLACVLELFRQAATRAQAVRLFGVALSNLVAPGRQLELPFGRPGHPDVGEVIDTIRERLGYDAVRLGVPSGKSKSLA